MIKIFYVALTLPLYKIIMSIKKEGHGKQCKMVVSRNKHNMHPPSKRNCMPNEQEVRRVRDSTCALKNHHLFLHQCTCSPACLPVTQRVIIRQKHTNESLYKHVVQQISHVQQYSVQAQIMSVIIVHRLHRPPGNIC